MFLVLVLTLIWGWEASLKPLGDRVWLILDEEPKVGVDGPKTEIAELWYRYDIRRAVTRAAVESPATTAAPQLNSVSPSSLLVANTLPAT